MRYSKLFFCIYKLFDQRLNKLYNVSMNLVQNNFYIFGLRFSMYGLLIAVGMLLAIFVVCKITNKRGMKPEDIYLVALYAIPLAIIGARLYYVIFSDHSFSFWEIFEIWNGGMAIYGGVIGGCLGVVLYCAIHKKNFLKIADLAVVGLILGQAIGRIGCYFGGCCYGIEVVNEGAMWFPLSVQINGVWHYSTFFYESICDFIIFAILLLFILKRKQANGSILCMYLCFYGFIRCIIEQFRGDSLYFFGMKVSQLLSIGLMILGIILLIIINTKSKKGKSVENNSNNKVD